MAQKGSRGATRIADVEPEHLADLDAGLAETRTLAEGLAVDLQALARAIGLDARSLEMAAGLGITRRMAAAGSDVLAMGGLPLARHLVRHRADTVRGWAAFAIAAAGLPLHDTLAEVRPLADDPHFGVREWAWLAVRPQIAAEAEAAIGALAPWTSDPSERIRRFAVEATRPRGVWCAHIGLLVREPERGLALLEPLKEDPARYVQLSVGNWLNDAAKSRPEWVTRLLARWTAEGGAPTILKRGARSL